MNKKFCFNKRGKASQIHLHDVFIESKLSMLTNKPDKDGNQTILPFKIL